MWVRVVVELAAVKEVFLVGCEFRFAVFGWFFGTVIDVVGVLFDDLVIFVTGLLGTMLVVCDIKGRFEFIGL